MSLSVAKKEVIQNVVLRSDLTNEDYHSMKDAISFSGLKEIKRSPAHYKKYLTESKKASDQMNIGSAVHIGTLEPHLFDKQVIKSPDINKRTKEGRLTWETFCIENQDKIVLSPEDFEKSLRMVDAVHKNKMAQSLLVGGKAEQSIFWNDPVTGVLCKCRPDYLRNDNIVIDVKTSRDASPEGFRSSIGQFKYHLQSAFYLEGVGLFAGKTLTEFVHMVIENEEPFGIGFYTLDDQSLGAGATEVRRLLEIYSECLNTGVWPSYGEKINNITIPAYLF